MIFIYFFIKLEYSINFVRYVPVKGALSMKRVFKLEGDFSNHLSSNGQLHMKLL